LVGGQFIREAGKVKKSFFLHICRFGRILGAIFCNQNVESSATKHTTITPFRCRKIYASGEKALLLAETLPQQRGGHPSLSLSVASSVSGFSGLRQAPTLKIASSSSVAGMRGVPLFAGPQASDLGNSTTLCDRP